MNTILKITAVLIITLTGLAGCSFGIQADEEPETVAVTGIILDQETLTLTVDDSFQLTAVITPENATNQEISFSSDASSVAAVDQNGLVTALSEGSAVITVTTQNGGRTDTCTVTAAPAAVTGVTLGRENLSLAINETFQLTAAIAPENATNQNVSWSSDAGTVATVDQNGLVTALAEGSAVITVTTQDNSFTDTCTVSVSPYPAGAFVTQWDMTTKLILDFPLDPDGVYDFIIDWGDGSIESYTSHEVQHEYSSSNFYTVTVTGTCQGFGTAEGDSEYTLCSVPQWGDVRLHNKGYQFSGFGVWLQAFNSYDSPDLSNVTNMEGMFSRLPYFNGDISDWDTSNAENMSFMFFNAYAFNRDISAWNTSSVTDMNQMFFQAYAFNADIGGWQTGSVMNMTGMFYQANSFNQHIGRWNTGNVGSMRAMFSETDSFNQDLSQWDVSKVLDTRSMFMNASAYTNAENPQGLDAWELPDGCITTDMFTDCPLTPLPDWY